MSNYYIVVWSLHSKLTQVNSPALHHYLSLFDVTGSEVSSAATIFNRVSELALNSFKLVLKYLF